MKSYLISGNPDESIFDTKAEGVHAEARTLTEDLLSCGRRYHKKVVFPYCRHSINSFRGGVKYADKESVLKVRQKRNGDDVHMFIMFKSSLED